MAEGGSGRAGGLAAALACPVSTEMGHGLTADGRTVVVAADQLLNVGEPEVRALTAHLNEQLLDPPGVAFAGSISPASRSHLDQKLIHHVAHALIFGDRRSPPQVIHGFMLPGADSSRDAIA